MSYLLIGNISALIGDDCIEPLVNARIRVYLPGVNQSGDHLSIVKGHFNNLRPLTAHEVLLKADRLLAEATLDHMGNFRMEWEEIHLFTEALELNLCLDEMPGKTGNLKSRNYRLSYLVPHWKKQNGQYLAAYAYLIPPDAWAEIYRNAGAWVITGVVKSQTGFSGEPHLKVTAYNAVTGKRIAETYTNEFGRYTMHFSRRDLYTGRLQLVRDGRSNQGPDIFFKIYRHDQLIWAEDESHAMASDRQDVAPCSHLDIIYKPGIFTRATRHISTWLHHVRSRVDTRKGRARIPAARVHSRLIVKD
ncbi:hypothetical protein SAMN05444266_103483 [Chitinophaga jiangningensis]|uniref:Uncharacterized protein n=1 Tax=Chitinophaga jiangningensis TaxID=1419482 RepID=A0A1M7B117_9BACT|nr:hypothetical protein [Chitinophaga jiangningensis]SHL48577.1 hypothetical protein SAMN05444266_103483 [Chitinophaga jiangningensis]